MKVRGWSDTAKEFKRPLEAIKHRETESPLEFPDRDRLADTLNLAQ